MVAGTAGGGTRISRSTEGKGRKGQTATAMKSIPMIAAPVLPFEQLAAVKSLKVKYKEGLETVESQMTIAGVRKHNSTYGHEG